MPIILHIETQKKMIRHEHLLSLVVLLSLGHAASGQITPPQKISPLSAGLGEGWNDVGRSIDEIGDFDGDGVVDLAAVIAGTFADTNRTQVWIVMLNENGTVRDQRLVDLPAGANHFALSITGIGDLDGDGVVDLAVGAPREPFRVGLRSTAASKPAS